MLSINVKTQFYSAIQNAIWCSDDEDVALSLFNGYRLLAIYTVVDDLIQKLKKKKIRQDIRAQVREVAIIYILFGLFKSEDILREGNSVGRLQGEEEEEVENHEEEKSNQSKTAATNRKLVPEASKAEKVDACGTTENKNGETQSKKSDQKGKKKRRLDKEQKTEEKEEEKSENKKQKKDKRKIVYYDED